MDSIDRTTFERLAEDARPQLRARIRRLVGHPDETDDLVQQSYLQAWENIAGFRGDSEFSSWLCSIGIRLAVDYLRRQKRWRVRAQVAYANECLQDEQLAGEIGQVFSTPEFSYEVNEHISYCFSCVGRSLNPDEYAAVVLREVMGLGNREAARTLGVTESVLRHRLAAGRRVMADSFEGLCSLVNKQGVCYQCSGLRDLAPDGCKGPKPPAGLDLDKRLGIVAASPDEQGTKALHDVFWRRTGEIEAAGRGSTAPTGCGESGDTS